MHYKETTLPDGTLIIDEEGPIPNRLLTMNPDFRRIRRHSTIVGHLASAVRFVMYDIVENNSGVAADLFSKRLAKLSQNMKGAASWS